MATISNVYVTDLGIDVKTQGAKGNGTTDDSGALVTANSLAITQGKSLVIPPGTYRISTNTTLGSATVGLEMQGGAIFSIDSGMSLTISGAMNDGMIQRFSGSGTVLITGGQSVRPEWWGARANDSTDNTTAIDKMLASISKGLVTWLAGTYRTNGGHIIPHGVSFQAASMQATIIKHMVSTGNLFRFPEPAAEATVDRAAASFPGMTFQGTGANGSATCFYIKNKANLNFKDTEVDGFKYGFRGARDHASNGVPGNSWIGCRIRNCYHCFFMPHFFDGNRIVGCQLHAKHWAVVCYDSVNVELTNNSFAIAASELDPGVGYIFMGGCFAFKIDTCYMEGDPPIGAGIYISQDKDIDGNTTPVGSTFPLSTGAGGLIQSCHASSIAGTPYLGINDRQRHVTWIANRAGSGIQTATIRLLTGTFFNTAIGNTAAPGTIVSFQTAGDSNYNTVLDNTSNNFIDNLSMNRITALERINVGSVTLATEADRAGNVVMFGGGATGHILWDGSQNTDDAALYINNWGYVGGITRFRDTFIVNGKNDPIARFRGETKGVSFFGGATFAADIDAPGGHKVVLSFYDDTVAASQTDVLLPKGPGTFKHYAMGYGGSVIGISVRSSDPRTVGTLTVEATIDATKTGLAATLDGTNTIFKTTTQAKDTDAFSVNNYIGCVITTSSDWAPITANITVEIFIEC